MTLPHTKKEQTAKTLSDATIRPTPAPRPARWKPEMPRFTREEWREMALNRLG